MITDNEEARVRDTDEEDPNAAKDQHAIEKNRDTDNEEARNTNEEDWNADNDLDGRDLTEKSIPLSKSRPGSPEEEAIFENVTDDVEKVEITNVEEIVIEKILGKNLPLKKWISSYSQ